MIVDFLALVVAVLVAAWLYLKYAYRNFPPGPRCWPLIGYIPYLGPRPHETFRKLTKQYGSVVGLTLGHKKVVVLGDWLAVEEALVNQADTFAGRPDMFCFDSVVKKRDVATADGPMWKEQRKFMLHTLKKKGFGCETFENTLRHSVQTLTETLEKHNGQDDGLHLDEHFFKAIMNITWKITGNRSYTEEDSSAVAFLAMAKENFLGFRNNQPLNFMPYLRHVVPGAFGYWKYVESFERLWNFLQGEVQDHLKTYVPGFCRDVIDCHIEEMKRRSGDDPEQAKAPHNIPHMTGSIYDLFLGGTDTSTNTLLWGFLYLCLYPDVQVKVHEELDRVIGTDRAPSIKDKPMLPYLEAFISEVHRYSCVVPLSILHSPVSDAKLFGYRIPKGTMVMQSIYGVHFDPLVWKEPERFDPQRFLDENNQVIKFPQLMPFSIGRRYCPGEPIGRYALFMIFSGLLQQFNFSVPPNSEKPSIVPNVGLTLSPKPFAIKVDRRKH